MNDLERIKEAAKELKLSLEAVASVKKAELPPRSIPEMLSDWKSLPPLTISPSLKSILAPKENDDV